MDAVGLPIVGRNPVGVEFRRGIGAPRIEGGVLILWDLLHLSVELRRGGLVETCLLGSVQRPDGFQQAQGPERVDVGGVLRGVERHLHVALGRQVVDLVRLDFLNEADEVRRVGQVPVVEEEPHVLFVRVLIEVVDAVGVELARSALEAVHLVAMVQKNSARSDPSWPVTSVMRATGRPLPSRCSGILLVTSFVCRHEA